MVAIHGYEAIKEAVVTQGQQFSGRPPITDNARYMAPQIHHKTGMAELVKLIILMTKSWHGNPFRITGQTPVQSKLICSLMRSNRPS